MTNDRALVPPPATVVVVVRAWMEADGITARLMLDDDDGATAATAATGQQSVVVGSLGELCAVLVAELRAGLGPSPPATGAATVPTRADGARTVPARGVAAGAEALWGARVSAVVVDDEDRLLLGRRPGNSAWHVTGCVVRPGERPAPAAVRAVRELSGVEVEVVALAAVVTGARPAPEAGDDLVSQLDLTFLCRAVAGSPPVPADPSQVAWFDRGALPETLGADSRAAIARALRYRADPTAGAWFDRP